MFAYEKPKKEQAYKGAVQKKESEKTVVSPNRTGIPDAMKARFEQASGFSFDDVRVYYNSDKPTHLQTHLQALAYTQGNQVYIAPGQEKYLAHELGHVVQQKQGRVKPTGAIGGVAMNDDDELEREADEIASKKQILQKETCASQLMAPECIRNEVLLSDESIGGVAENDDPELEQATDFIQFCICTTTSLNNVIQPKLFIGNVEYINDGVLSDKEVGSRKSISEIEFSAVSAKKRALSMVKFAKEYRFGTINDFNEWIRQSEATETLAQMVHQEIYKKIKEKLTNRQETKDAKTYEKEHTHIAGTTMSTTGILFNPETLTLEFSFNFAISKKKPNTKKWVTEGYIVEDGMLREVLDELEFEGKDVKKYNIILHNQSNAEFIATNSTETATQSKEEESKAKAKKMVFDLLKDKMKEVNYGALHIHADAVLMDSVNKKDIRNPITGISKAPCELCHSEGVPGRSDDASTGLGKGNYLDVSEGKIKEIHQTEGKSIIKNLIKEAFYDIAKCEDNGKGLKITVNNWIPPSWVNITSTEVITQMEEKKTIVALDSTEKKKQSGEKYPSSLEMDASKLAERYPPGTRLLFEYLNKTVNCIGIVLSVEDVEKSTVKEQLMPLQIMGADKTAITLVSVWKTLESASREQARAPHVVVRAEKMLNYNTGVEFLYDRLPCPDVRNYIFSLCERDMKPIKV